MQEAFTYNDVSIKPKFSMVNSRSEVDLTSMGLSLPIISANMDTVTSVEMCKAMNLAGGVGCLHRFMSIEDNVKNFMDSKIKPWVSIGLGQNELERATALFNAGAENIVIDIAHGASLGMLKQVIAINKIVKSNAGIIVGNFGDGKELYDFNERLKGTNSFVYAYKVGIGGGAACTTRVKTGCGVPSLTAILSCKGLGLNIIADGGISTPGNAAKALGAGAHAVMCGNFLAGTDESPGEYYETNLALHYQDPPNILKQKKYRGSASQESYDVQNKIGKHRTAEGESFLIPYKGPVANQLQDLEGGLKIAFSYVGAFNIVEFHDKVEFVRITQSGHIEGQAYGKK
jgi:IMP dehydrogenase